MRHPPVLQIRKTLAYAFIAAVLALAAVCVSATIQAESIYNELQRQSP